MQLARRCFVAAALATPCAWGQPATAYVDGQRDSLVVFLPVASKRDASLEARLARSYAQVTVEAVKQCLGEGRAEVGIAYADGIVVRRAGSEQRFDLTTPTLPGALMVRPGASPRIVFAGGGADALRRLVTPAAAEYFGAKCDSIPGS